MKSTRNEVRQTDPCFMMGCVRNLGYLSGVLVIYGVGVGGVFFFFGFFVSFFHEIVAFTGANRKCNIFGRMWLDR